MTRKRPDYRDAITTLLWTRGPMRLAQILEALGSDATRATVDYDLRVLRQAGAIVTVRGLWRRPPITHVTAALT